MKLVTFSSNGPAEIGCVDAENQTVLPLQRAHVALHGAANPAFESMLALMNAGEAAVERAREIDARGGQAAHHLPLKSVKLLAPVPVPEQIRDFSTYEIHLKGAPSGMRVLKARLAGEPLPDLAALKTQIKPPAVYYKQPIYYLSNRFSVVGTDTDVQWPDYCEYLDFETEFGIFLGKTGKNIAEGEAGRYIFGYSIFNDFSARDQQSKEMEGFMGPTKGKSFDCGNAIGPWIVTPDEIPDPSKLKVAARINGEVWAQSTTANMLQSFTQMIAYVSRSETVHAGEFFASGTVGGCCGLEMDRWLKPGDVVELEIERLGVLRNKVVR